MTSGLHHITLITRKVQANVDFYAGFLGMRLVKRTAGFEDATQLHLFYGDALASPGSLVTFLVWEDGSPGRVGHGAPGEIALAIHSGAIGFWLTRALQFGVKASGPAQEFGEPVLRLTDPDGIIVKLIGVSELTGTSPWTSREISEADAIQRLHSGTIFSEKPVETIAFLTSYMGFTEAAHIDSITRLRSDAGDVIDIRDAAGFWTAAPGTGTIDHIAVRATDRAHVEAVAARLNAEGHGPTNVHDRTYFYSLYVREPSGTLLEMATDGPGFTLDEPLETLGTELFVPAHFRKDAIDDRVMLPQFGLPGEPRTIYRDLPFIHRLHVPDEPDGSTVILLHGTAGNEASLMPLGRRLFPNATLIGLRGRSTGEGVARFFGRFDPTTFDQKDIRSEAEAFEAFMDEAMQAYGLDEAKLTFLGYSNGANMIGASMLLHPRLIRRAILLRPAMVLEEAPVVDLSGSRVLMVSGVKDPYISYAAPLERALVAAGADVAHEEIDFSHGLSPEDEAVAAKWLKGS